MTFDKILDDDRLWAVRYDDEDDNALYSLFDQWSDVRWLRTFFKENITDLERYFNITNIHTAIEDTIEDSEKLQGIIMDMSPDANLDELFHPLDNNRTSDETLGTEKGKIKKRRFHPSWLRIYAIKLSDGNYIVTGGAIKLTYLMEERAHTQKELDKLAKVRYFLLNEGIVEDDGFMDYVNTL